MNLSDKKPTERRIVITVTDDDYYVLQTEKEGIALLNQSNVAIVPVDTASDLDKFSILTERGTRFREGLILVLSPFNDFSYVELTEAKNLIAIEKMHLTIRLCQLLGATEVEIKRIEIIDEEKGEGISLEVEAASVSGQLESKLSDLRQLGRSMQVSAKFAGGFADKELSTKFLRENHLDSDQALRHIVGMRTIPNSLTEIVQDISLTESLQSSFEILASLNLPEILQHLHLPTIKSVLSSKEYIKEKTEIVSRIKITFPKDQDSGTLGVF